MTRKRICTSALVALIALAAGSAFAQDNQALIDALVRKGILTQKEAEKIQAEVSKNPAVSEQAQSPIKLAPWIKELKLSGDLRLRYQYDTAQLQEPILPNTNGTNGTQQRSRWRFRLRLFADYVLDNGFFGGFGLQTSAANDTGNQTFTDAYRNYSIFISKAFLGWNGYPGLTFIAGKQDLPFYETDLFYDPSLYPSGAVERIDFHKLFGWGAAGKPVADGKEGKAPPPPPPKPQNAFELSLIAGQFIMFDNNEFALSGLNNDAYQFQEQLLFRYKTPSWSVTIGPELFTPNKAAVGHSSFTSTTSTLVTGVDGFAFHTRPLFFGPNPPANTHQRLGEESDLFIIRGPGDITLNLIPHIPIKIYWDLAYNFDGGKRFNLLGTSGQSTDPAGAGPTGIFSFIEHVTPGHHVPAGTVFPTTTGDATGIAFPRSALVGNTFDDDFAWVVGIRIGDNKKAGDWSIYGDFRQVGVASVDPEVGPSDPMNGRLNFQGFGMGVLYNVTDFFLLSVSGRIDWNLKNLYGGQLTRGSGIADYNSWNYVRVDAIMKF